MLKLRALQMFNWGYAPYQEPLPVGDITLLRGNNGSGKTTYLTGIALLLGMRRPKHQSIEQFIHPEADWAFIRGLADNQPDEQGLRPFDRVLPASYQDVVTLACLLELKGGRWQRSYYIVPGDFVPEPDLPVDKQHQYTQTDYRKMLAYVGVRDALLRLLEMGLFGVQDISRDPASRFQFFLNLVGDEDIQKRYEEARQTWQEQSQKTLHILDEQTRAEGDLSRLEAQVRLAQERRKYKTQLEQARVLRPHAQVREWRQQMQAQVAARDAANGEIEGLRRQVAANEANRREWRGKYEAFLVAYEAWRAERDKAEQAAREAEVSYERAKTLYEQQRAYVEQLHALPNITPGAAQNALDEAEERLSEVSAHLRELDVKRRALMQEIARLEQNLPTFPDYVARFIQALDDAGIPHLLVADAIETTDRVWLEALAVLVVAETVHRHTLALAVFERAAQRDEKEFAVVVVTLVNAVNGRLGIV